MFQVGDRVVVDNTMEQSYAIAGNEIYHVHGTIMHTDMGDDAPVPETECFANDILEIYFDEPLTCGEYKDRTSLYILVRNCTHETVPQFDLGGILSG